MRTASICQRVPRAVRKHTAYVVDTVALGCSDILSYGDDNGSWGGHTKPRRKYKIEVSEQLGITRMRRYHSNDKGSPDPEVSTRSTEIISNMRIHQSSERLSRQ